MNSKRKDYHCCATCIHFRAERANHRVRTYCSRLGYDTRPEYKFKCWNPKETIVKKIQTENEDQ
nr:hypothetical protein [Alicyclobacillus herbarius]